ncbi:hypothetical protein AAHE18_13G155400 [Arachis hypogaea]
MIWYMSRWRRMSRNQIWILCTICRRLLRSQERKRFINIHIRRSLLQHKFHNIFQSLQSLLMVI